MRMTLTTKVPQSFLNEMERRARASYRIPEAIEISAIKLRDMARSHSEGRPGPRIQTFQFWSAWTYAIGGWDAEVANGSVYAARLEFGFFGVDAIGRMVHQPPYPSLQPAIAQADHEDLLAVELAKVLFK